MTDQERIEKLEDRIEALEKEARHFERQLQMLIHHHKHVDGLVQSHEAKVFKIEQLLTDDHK